MRFDKSSLFRGIAGLLAFRRRRYSIAIAALISWLNLASAAAQALTFEVETNDPTCGACTLVYVTGEFDQSSLPAFEEFLSAHELPLGTTIVLNSPGGSLFDAIDIGEVIRHRRFHTSVFGRVSDDGHAGGVCASACAYAFLGGTHRTIGETARFGLHQFSGTARRGDAVSQAQSVVSVIANYVRRMGASQEVVEIASAIPPQGIEWLSASQLHQLGITTGRGTRFAPVWAARPAQVIGGIMMEAESLLADGAVAGLSLGCGFWDRHVDRGPPAYGLIVTLPDPPGGLPALRQFQLSHTRILNFTIFSLDSSKTIASIAPNHPAQVFSAFYGLSFSVELEAPLLEQLVETGFTLAWHPAVAGRERVNVPAARFRTEFEHLRTACESSWR